MMGVRSRFFNIILKTGKMTQDNIFPEITPERQLSAAAKRALAEAQERRVSQQQPELPQETGGRGGAEPSRFGDWEIKGRAIDF
jgi:hypothetical protein